MLLWCFSGSLSVLSGATLKPQAGARAAGPNIARCSHSTTAAQVQQGSMRMSVQCALPHSASSRALAGALDPRPSRHQKGS